MYQFLSRNVDICDICIGYCMLYIMYVYKCWYVTYMYMMIDFLRQYTLSRFQPPWTGLETFFFSCWLEINRRPAFFFLHATWWLIHKVWITYPLDNVLQGCRKNASFLLPFACCLIIGKYRNTLKLDGYLFDCGCSLDWIMKLNCLHELLEIFWGGELEGACARHCWGVPWLIQYVLLAPKTFPLPPSYVILYIQDRPAVLGSNFLTTSFIFISHVTL